MAGINANQSRCPYCGHGQTESSHLISTFCRGCGRYYSASERENTSLAPAPNKKKAISYREVTCHRCSQYQHVSTHAKTTLCIQCNTSISFTNVHVAQISQEIDTRGQLTISPKGYLEGGLSICGSALIKGKFSGILICEQTARLFGKGRYRAQLIAKSVLIEPEADLYFHFPVCAEELIVYGQLTAATLCKGRIRVQKKGLLYGPGWARAIEVAKYGRYTGHLHIDKDEPKRIPTPPFGEFPQLRPHQYRRILSGESPI